VARWPLPRSLASEARFTTTVISVIRNFPDKWP